MKRDAERARLLAAALEGGAPADEIEPLLPAIGRLRELFAHLGPDAEMVSSLLPRLYRDHLRSQPNDLRLAHPTLSVSDMAASLRFYRDMLGLRLRSENEWFAELEAGDGAVALQWTGPDARLPRVGGVCLEFWSDDLPGAVERLRRLGMQVALGCGRRGPYAELCDPDGHTLRLVGFSSAERAVGGRAEVRAVSEDRDE
jgi:catechol 2,3-dioxygenase-like lactoylglutathione lyase family enzyme